MVTRDQRKTAAVTKLVVVAAAAVLVGGCGSDHLQDKDASSGEALMREALCVIASERFQLYDEAKRHLGHAEDVVRIRQDQDKESDLPGALAFARRELYPQSPKLVATLLQVKCDTELTNGEFARAR